MTDSDSQVHRTRGIARSTDTRQLEAGIGSIYGLVADAVLRWAGIVSPGRPGVACEPANVADWVVGAASRAFGRLPMC